MKMTSAQASKLLKQLKTEESELLGMQDKCNTFKAAIQENIEDVRPQYDYVDVEKQLRNLEGKIRKLKHAINVFNTTTKVDGLDMTIDEVLVYIPQLTYNKTKFKELSERLPKERVSDRYSSSPSNFIEYNYANYNIDDAKENLRVTREELDKVLIALDRVNNTVEMEIDI